MIKQRFQILGMHCVGCAGAINSTLKHLPGVKAASASYAKQTADVEYDENRVTTAQIVLAINEVGYGARLVEN